LVGSLAKDADVIIEGVFRFADTLQWYVVMFITCELTSRYIYQTVSDDVIGNIMEPLNILQNLARNQFNLISDLFVIAADFFYQDHYSVSFWLGDVFYQIMVMEPDEDEYYK